MHFLSRHAVMGFTALAMGLALSSTGWAATNQVNISLWSKQDADVVTGLGMGTNSNMSIATMGITDDRASVKAGRITLHAINDSTLMVHEMIIAPVADPDTPLPYDTSMERVDEEAAGSLGEVSELDPGASGSLTLDLKSGTYVLYCNIPGHYASGMWTLLSVTG